VSAVNPRGTFANLRCHIDRNNPDNLEVVHSYVPGETLACVLYVVGAPTSLPPPDPAPPAPPVAATTVVPTPDDGAVAPQPEPVGSTTTTAQASTTTSSVPSSTTAAAPAPPADEQALPALGSFAVRVEVGGVTRGVAPGRVVGAESSWQAPLRVEYHCGNTSRSISVDPPQPPGFVALLPAIAVPAGGGSCVVVATDTGSRGQLSELTIDREPVAPGVAKAVTVAAGEQAVVTVIVHYDGTALGALERGAAPTTSEPDAAVAEAAAPAVPAPGSQLTPVVGFTLGAVFVVGLALSILAARRPL
jgi:hypothetical protein